MSIVDLHVSRASIKSAPGIVISGISNSGNSGISGSDESGISGSEESGISESDESGDGNSPNKSKS